MCHYGNTSCPDQSDDMHECRPTRTVVVPERRGDLAGPALQALLDHCDRLDKTAAKASTRLALNLIRAVRAEEGAVRG